MKQSSSFKIKAFLIGMLLAILTIISFNSFGQSEIKISNLNNNDIFTHIALVDMTDDGLKGRQIYKLYEREFIVLPYVIINPFELDGKRAQKEREYLNSYKNKNWLYAFYHRKLAPGKSEYEINFILKDYEGKKVYEAYHYDNTVLETLITLNNQLFK
tara:strand:- start:211 stop:684 length:474 start_codon:yes stop_codon:yes gene_type:complete